MRSRLLSSSRSRRGFRTIFVRQRGVKINELRVCHDGCAPGLCTHDICGHLRGVCLGLYSRIGDGLGIETYHPGADGCGRIQGLHELLELVWLRVAAFFNGCKGFFNDSLGLRP
jgi:hypothetical protein